MTRRPRPTFARVEVVAPPVTPALTLVVRRGIGLAVEVSGLDAATARDGAVGARPRGRRMMGLAGGRAVYLATGVSDLRRGVTGQYTLILEHLAPSR